MLPGTSSQENVPGSVFLEDDEVMRMMGAMGVMGVMGRMGLMGLIGPITVDDCHTLPVLHWSH